ncbi:hypothetical protein Q8F55_002934 [Vanrija albida]|uniref:Uncharacterized protein n=1 Tax=Vanrija albida TaxID=181172 RepID=A0ABR3QB71_9TREE
MFPTTADNVTYASTPYDFYEVLRQKYDTRKSWTHTDDELRTIRVTKWLKRVEPGNAEHTPWVVPKGWWKTPKGKAKQ